MTAESRVALMEKLRACYQDSKTQTSTSTADSSSNRSGLPPFAPYSGLPGVISNLVTSVPSRSIFLRNLFKPPVTDLHIIEEIKEDVLEKAMQFGSVVDHALDPL